MHFIENTKFKPLKSLSSDLVLNNEKFKNLYENSYILHVESAAANQISVCMAEAAFDFFYLVKIKDFTFGLFFNSNKFINTLTLAGNFLFFLLRLLFIRLIFFLKFKNLKKEKNKFIQQNNHTLKFWNLSVKTTRCCFFASFFLKKILDIAFFKKAFGLEFRKNIFLFNNCKIKNNVIQLCLIFYFFFKNRKFLLFLFLFIFYQKNYILLEQNYYDTFSLRSFGFFLIRERCCVTYFGPVGSLVYFNKNQKKNYSMLNMFLKKKERDFLFLSIINFWFQSL